MRFRKKPFFFACTDKTPRSALDDEINFAHFLFVEVSKNLDIHQIE